LQHPSVLGRTMNRFCIALICVYGTLLLTACGGGSSSDVATHLSVSAPAMAVAGTEFQITVTARDSTGKVVTSYAGAVHLTSGDSQAVLPASATLTDGAGTFPATLRTPGNQTITAAAVMGSLAGISPAIAVIPGPATHFAVSGPTAFPPGTAYSVLSGAAFNFTVTALDASNNVAEVYQGIVQFSSSDGQAVLPANSTLTDGTGTFPVTLRTAGGQTITVTDTVTASIKGTSSSIDVISGGPATNFSVSVPASANAGTSFRFTVTAQDRLGNVDSTYPGIVHFVSSDAMAALPPNSVLTDGIGTFSATLQTVGSQTITATDSVTAAIAGTSSPIAIGAAVTPPIRFSISAPAAARSGTAIHFTVTALDPSNNVVSGYAGRVQFSSTDATAVLPPSSTLTGGIGTFAATLQTAGAQTLTATDTINLAFTGTSSSIDVSPGPATHFSVYAPTRVRPGSITVTVAALDAASNVAVSYAGTLHFSSTDAKAALPANSTLTDGTGSFYVTLRTVGSQTVTVTDTAVPSIAGTSNSIDVFSYCLMKGEQCGLMSCCPGLQCVAEGDRAYCE